MAERDRRRWTRREAGAAVLAAGAVAALPRRALAAADFNAAGIGWREPGRGFAEAAETRRPVFLLVHAEWCPQCRTYAELFHRARVEAALSAYVPVLVDQDREREVARAYAPDGMYIPRSLILDHEARHVAAVRGPNAAHRWFLPVGDERGLLDYLARGREAARPGGSGPKRMAAPKA